MFSTDQTIVLVNSIQLVAKEEEHAVKMTSLVNEIGGFLTAKNLSHCEAVTGLFLCLEGILEDLVKEVIVRVGSNQGFLY